MLNLNYNTTFTSLKSADRHVATYNYSASIWVIGSGGGGGNSVPASSNAGGGGGGGFALSSSLTIIPNITYQIFAGTAVSATQNGNDSYFIGYDGVDTNQIIAKAQGGLAGESETAFLGGDGGNTGTGSLFVNNVLNVFTSFNGGTGAAGNPAGIPYAAGGGGGGARGNGGNGAFPPPATSGDGGLGVNPAIGYGNILGRPSYGGAGGAFNVSSGIGGFIYSSYGYGGNGASAGVGGASGKGVVYIQYDGVPKAFVTNGSTVYIDGITYHIFDNGAGTFLYTYPYPW